MTNKRKIQILEDKIEILREENESLRNENKLLYEHIDTLQNFGKENSDSIHMAINELNKKKSEYDELIRRCKRTQSDYEELNKEMSRMMSEYEGDVNGLMTGKVSGK